jgi:hypothetical protein
VKRLFGLTAILMMSCAAPASDPAPATPAPAPAATASAPAPAATQTAPAAPPASAINLSQRCTNAQYRLSIAYPAGWFTNDGSVVPACSAFDVQPVQVPRESEMPFEIAIVLGVDDVKVDDVTRSSQFERVLSRAPVTIAGRQGLRVEVEATGEGLADKGMRSVRYAIPLPDGRTFLATTHDRAASYERNQEILERMMASIKFE